MGIDWGVPAHDTHCQLQDKDKDKDKILKIPNMCYIFEKLSVQGYQIWHSCIISPSWVHHECTISASSAHHQTKPGQKRLQSRGPDSRNCFLVCTDVTMFSLSTEKRLSGQIPRRKRSTQTFELFLIVYNKSKADWWLSLYDDPSDEAWWRKRAKRTWVLITIITPWSK